MLEKISNPNHRKYILGILVSTGVIFFLLVLLKPLGLTQQIELLLLNMRTSVRYATAGSQKISQGISISSSGRGKSQQIQIIKMDNQAFLKYGQMPWKRSVYAIPLNKFAAGQYTATVILSVQSNSYDHFRIYRSEKPVQTAADLKAAKLCSAVRPGNTGQFHTSVILPENGNWFLSVTGVEKNGTEVMGAAPTGTEVPLSVTVKPALQPQLQADLQKKAQQSQLNPDPVKLTGKLRTAQSLPVSSLHAYLNYPTAFFFDVFFLDKKDPVQDNVLIRSLSKNSRVYVDYMLREKEQTPYPDQELRLREIMRFAITNIRGNYSTNSLLGTKAVDLPIPEITARVSGAGFANPKVDIDDYIRSWRMVVTFPGNRFKNKFFPSAPLILAMAYYKVNPADVSIHFGKHILLRNACIPKYNDLQQLVSYKKQDVRIPIDSEGVMEINYIGPPGTFIMDPEMSSFTYFDQYQPSSLNNNIYLIGLYEQAVQTKDRLTDFWPTPQGQMFGIEIIANTLNTIVTRNFLVRVPQAYNNLIVIFLCLFLGLLLPRLSIFKGGVLVLLTLILFIFAGFYLYEYNIIINMILPVLGVFFTYLSTSVYKTFTEESEKKMIRTQFGKFVNKDVVDQLLKDPGSLRLGGERKELTVLFSDIRSFTTISEGMDAEELVNFLNQYLAAMTSIVLNSDGTLDKYVGDEIMAFWGAPLPNEEHAFFACKAAVEMVETLRNLNAGWPPNRQLRIGIGLNTGQMLVGQVGSESRMDYTVMGDHVNLGARLEGVNKVYGTTVIISEFTYAAVQDRVIARELDLIRVKGKNKPVKIFELLAIKD